MRKERGFLCNAGCRSLDGKGASVNLASEVRGVKGRGNRGGRGRRGDRGEGGI